MGREELGAFVGSARAHGLQCALAGSIRFEDIPAIKAIGPDIIGIRGLVCGGDRNDGIRADLVGKLKAMLN
jgi:uncharacterized protein (UPF0264 family)